MCAAKIGSCFSGRIAGEQSCLHESRAQRDAAGQIGRDDIFGRSAHCGSPDQNGAFPAEVFVPIVYAD